VKEAQEKLKEECLSDMGRRMKDVEIIKPSVEECVKHGASVRMGKSSNQRSSVLRHGVSRKLCS
jgi:hypothetical protein